MSEPEFVTIQVGGAGCRIGNSFWKRLNIEHGIDTYDNESDKLRLAKNVNYEETESGNFSPRCVFIDTDSTPMDTIRSSQMGKLFNPERFIHGNGSNFIQMRYGAEGNELVEASMDEIRNLVEKCENFRAFKIIHSLGGATTSGYLIDLIRNLHEEYILESRINFTIFPDFHLGSYNVLEPYHSIFLFYHLIQSSDFVGVVLNSNLERFSLFNRQKKGEEEVPIFSTTSPFENENEILSRIMSGVTSSMRFPAGTRGNFLKMCMNLSPFTRFNHFYSLGISPWSCLSNDEKIDRRNVESVVEPLLDIRNSTAYIDPKNGSFLSTQTRKEYFPKSLAPFNWVSANITLQGPQNQVSQFELENIFLNLKRKRLQANRKSFNRWMNGHFCPFVSYNPPSVDCEDDYSATVVGYHGNTCLAFKRIKAAFQKLFKKKAFVHHFEINGGIEESDFFEAEEWIYYVIDEYGRIGGEEQDEDYDVDEDED